ncbi:MAG: GNAT family N-acetyltransferase [Anaerolineales bacterium]|jgi:CelD/BcsL family acetyltransferase involved in cellulose biosynthesis
MELKVIRKLQEFDALAGEWNSLLAHSASHVPFLRHEYLSSWWRTLGGGEWSKGELCIVTARDENGSLCGIAPLFATENLSGEAALMLLGSIEISDYLDIIAAPVELATFLEVLFEALDSPDTPDWRLLDWYNILDSSPTLPAMKAAAEKKGWSFTQSELQHCPYIPLPGDWDTYLGGIKKKQRHEIRRKMRRAASNDPATAWYIVQNEATLEAEMEDFFTLMAQDPDKDKFLTEAMRKQMQATVKTAFQSGWLQLAFLEVGGGKAAGYLNFDYGNHIWVYNSGIDFSHSAISPGWVLLGHLLKWANEQGRKALDFMRGDEAYKYRFGGIDRFVVRAQVRR